MTEIYKETRLSKIKRELIFFVLWDNKNKRFIKNTKSPYLTWSKEIDIPDAFLKEPERYKSIEVNLAHEIPSDIIRLIELGPDFSDIEKQSLITQKLRQLIYIFIFSNEKFKTEIELLYTESSL
jgi:hypothetical protein